MPYVNVPNDLSKIKTKIAFNLTKRQLICFGGAALVGVPVYLLSRSSIGSTGAMFLMLAVMLPVTAMAEDTNYVTLEVAIDSSLYDNLIHAAANRGQSVSEFVESVLDREVEQALSETPVEVRDPQDEE